jgi:16S rRNA (cytidine1402-2'-O)-methyltransferase
MGKLFLVGTPIGNLGDFSPRAAEVLASTDLIAAEDTRVTAKLLHAFNIKTPMISYHAHNHKTSGEAILARIQAGENVALVTDAGMPSISDPGEELVRACRASGVAVESVPGPVAFATALALSGMPSGRFTFEGFLSVAKNSREAHLESLKGETRTMLFYEAPHKMPQTLRDFARCFGDRPLAIVRELTKIHEEVIQTTCTAAARDFAAHTFKGEIVLVLGGANKQPKTTISLEEAAALARAYAKANNCARTEAAHAIAKQTGCKKNAVYTAMLREEEGRNG